MLTLSTIRLCWRSLGRLARLLTLLVGGLAVLFALIVVLLRYWLLPDIDRYHDLITTSLSKAIGNPVTIGKIEADWQGLRPSLEFSNVQILDEQKQPALTLPHVHNVISWLALLTGRFGLYSLEIERPQLLIRRTVQGKIYIGGVPVSQQGSNNDLSDWVLHQPHLVARNAEIVWLDEQNNKDALVLSNVNVRIDNLFSRHRFSLRAVPPVELAKPLDIRGDFRGASFDNLDAWNGQLFAQVEYADVVAWRHWLDLPKQFSQGQGGVRAWLEIKKGQPERLTLDLNLRDVLTKLDDTRPVMALNRMFGRVVWTHVTDGIMFTTQQLSGQLQNGVTLPPTDLTFHRYQAGGELRFNAMQIESLISLLQFLPVESKLRDQLNLYAPQGRVQDFYATWQGELDNPSLYKISAKFDNLAMQQVEHLPGFTGLSFAIEADETGGKLQLASPQLLLNTGKVMREVFPPTSINGQATWQRVKNGWEIKLEPTQVVNADLDGQVFATYKTKVGSKGMLDLTAKLKRGDVRQAARYTPIIAVDPSGSDWLHSSLLSGSTNDLYIKVKGDLSQFPPGPGKNALFELGGHARGVTLDFATGWPRIENISGEVLIRNNILTVKSPSATMAGSQLQNVQVTMPDFKNPHLPLQITGTAIAPGNTFLQFVQNSPVRGYIDGFTDGMSATGNASLDLSLYIPLMDIDVPPAPHHEKVKVAGTVHVQDSDIHLGEGIPLLQKTTGSLDFTESGMTANQVATHIWGEAASVSVKSTADGAVHASLQGRNSIETLRKVSVQPLLKFMTGSVAWQADLHALKKEAQLKIQSDLLGVTSSLPAPFNKRADERWPLLIENTAQGGFNVQLADLLHARLLERNGELKRLTVNFANTGVWPEKDGLWLTGSLPTLELSGWGDVMAGAGAGLALAGVDVKVKQLHVAGRPINNLHVQAHSQGDGLAAQLSSDMLAGDIEWQPKGAGKLTARLKKLNWRGSEVSKAEVVSSAKTSNISPDQLPALQIAIETLQYKDKNIGAVELVGQPEWRGWRLERISLSNADAKISGEGYWPSIKENSKLNLQLDIHDSGKLLSRFGYPGTMKAGKGQLNANLSWHGGPQEFALTKLDGSLKLETGSGQFLKMEPGMGKLLSIFSLQALPKRITLDFADVFSQGFQFDGIKGNAQIRNGVMDVQDMYIDGSSAKVAMKGQVDLNNETQNLRVRVLPTVGNSVSLIGAFTAGPVVGVGALILNKVLGNPLDKLASFEYNISGTWADPNVAKVGQAPIEIQKNP